MPAERVLEIAPESQEGLAMQRRRILRQFNHRSVLPFGMQAALM
ncbi:MAG: hypothetical protein ACOH2T_28610 [Pseudomonas sp.]